MRKVEEILVTNERIETYIPGGDLLIALIHGIIYPSPSGIMSRIGITIKSTDLQFKASLSMYLASMI